MSQAATPQADGLLAPPTGRSGLRRVTPDLADPLSILQSKGVNQTNSTDPAALAAVIDSYGDFKHNGKYKGFTIQIAAEFHSISKLLKEMARTQTQHATKEDIQNAVHEIKQSIGSFTSISGKSYAQVTGTQGHMATPHQKTPLPQNQDLKNKQIFISMRDAESVADTLTLTPPLLLQHFNALLTAHFAKDANGNINMSTPLRAVTRSAAGNITLTFKTEKDADYARTFDEWITQIDPKAAIPQRYFAVVVHNVPTDIWNENSTNENEAIRYIEKENNMELDIAKLSWLNNPETRQKTKRGPLMVCFKSRAQANSAISQCMTFNGELCNVSLHIPRAQQCFRCQDWGHRATECTGEARCGICAGTHNTSNHNCTHDETCTTGQRCTIDKPKCANCGGDHNSWIRSCPSAKAAFAAQTRREEYRTGRYEPNTPFTLSDILFKTSKPKAPNQNPHSCHTPTSLIPEFNHIPPTSPIDPDA